MAAAPVQTPDELVRQKLVADQEKNQAFTPYVQPNYGSLIDPRTGQLGDAYKVNIAGLDPSQWQGYSEYKKEALRTGPSAWANLQQQQIASQTKSNQEAAARQAQSGENQVNNNLAMRGGVSAGARAMQARSSARDLLNARQQAARQGTTNTQQLASTDEQNRIAQLGNLQSSEQSLGQYNKNIEGQQAQYNTNNLLNEKQGERTYNLNAYNKQMDTYAAEKQAEATRNSGGGGK